MTTIISLSGKKQSGKNQVAAFIAKHSGVKCTEIGFADALKEEVARATGVTVQHINENKSQFRPILQWWGTDFRRAIDQEYWVKKFFGKLEEKLKEDYKILIVTDTRFYNEYALCNMVGAVMMRVERKGLPEDNHLSETSLNHEKFHYTINNNGTLADLEEVCKGLVNTLNLKK